MAISQEYINDLITIIKKISANSDIQSSIELAYALTITFGNLVSELPASGPYYLRGNATTPNSVRIQIVGDSVNVQNTVDGVTWNDLNTIANPV